MSMPSPAPAYQHVQTCLHTRHAGLHLALVQAAVRVDGDAQARGQPRLVLPQEEGALRKLLHAGAGKLAAQPLQAKPCVSLQPQPGRQALDWGWQAAGASQMLWLLLSGMAARMLMGCRAAHTKKCQVKCWPQAAAAGGRQH